MPIESTAFTVVHDKLLTQLKMQQSGLPMPGTYLAATPDAAKKILETADYPIIMKFPQGTQGKGAGPEVCRLPSQRGRGEIQVP